MKPTYASLSLTPLQISALRCIFDHPGRMQKEIAEDIGVSPPVLVGILRNLEERGYIESRRKADNRRAISVFATDKGSDIVAVLSDKASEVSAKALSGFSEDETEEFLSLLNRIMENLSK